MIHRAFTLTELVVVILIIGIIASVVVARVSDASDSALASSTLQVMQTFEQAALLYHAERGSLPKDRNPGVMPPELAGKLANIDMKSTPLGGQYDWNGPGTSVPYLGISIIYKASEDIPKQQLLDIDQALDDGDLSSGYVRLITRSGQAFFQFCLQSN